MTRKPHRLLSLRISTFIALMAVAALAIGIVALRDSGSANPSTDADVTPATLNTVAPAARTASSSQTPSQIYSSTHTGVVKITTESGLGTGIVLDKQGDILTNDHVVEGSNRFNVCRASFSSRAPSTSGRTSLIAASRANRRCSARHTSPMPPVPSRSIR